MAHSTTKEESRSDWLIQWDVLKTVTWIESNCFKRVTLQFPDELLAESTLVAAAIQQECATRHISTQVSGHLLVSTKVYRSKQRFPICQVTCRCRCWLIPPITHLVWMRLQHSMPRLIAW